jgi:hypothetical protein
VLPWSTVDRLRHDPLPRQWPATAVKEDDRWIGEYGTTVPGDPPGTPKAHRRYRHQVDCRQARERVQLEMDACMRHYGVLGARHTKGVYALRGGVAQDLHTDFAHARVVSLLQSPDRVPLTCLWASEHAFNLRVRDVDELVHVPAGHMVVFLATLFHGGARALSGHFRLHGYVVPSVGNYIVDAVFT